MSLFSDPTAVDVISQLAATSIWTAAARFQRYVADKGSAFDRTSVTTSLQESLASVDWTKVDVESSPEMLEYLRSPDFATLVFHVTEMSFAGATDLIGSPLQAILRAGLFTHKVDDPDQIVKPLLQAIVGVIEQSVPFVDPDLASLAVMSVNVASIEHHSRRVSELTPEDLAEFQVFAERYRTVVAQRTSTISPPDFEDRRRIDFDDLYVAPKLVGGLDPPGGDRFRRRFRSFGMDIDEFISSLDRVVILGDPGGGKSTLARKVALELTRGARHTSGVAYLPILVVLRSYAERRKDDGLSLVQYLETHSRSDYQLDPPKGAFEWLLQSGQCVVILDGLDELMDTSLRIELTESVESFALAHSACPMVVTSRQVGYSRAPLDGAIFKPLLLDPFDREETSEYSRKWFALDKSLSHSQRSRIVSAFEEETKAVTDLTSNPLLLSLMCAIYRGESYIPRNRPEVYEKCALLLFERWDRRRGIVVTLPFETHVEPLMKHLALWIYRGGLSAGGVRESDLVAETASYLESVLYSGAPDEARAAAKKFVEYCCGRAWVFTDVGSTADGELLFSFTHRTFMEYFSAAQLAREAKSTGGLLKELLPRIRRAEWDVVAQMAIHLHSKANIEAGDEICQRLSREAHKTNYGSEYRFNSALFGVRCLEFLVPPRDTTTLLISTLLDMIPNNTDLLRLEVFDYGPVGPVASLSNVAKDNRPAVLSALNEFLSDSEHELDVLIGPLSFKSLTVSRSWLWEALLQEDSPALKYLNQTWETQPWAAESLREHGLISCKEVLAACPLAEWFVERQVPGAQVSYAPLALLVVRGLLGFNMDTDTLDEWRKWTQSAIEAVESWSQLPNPVDLAPSQSIGFYFSPEGVTLRDDVSPDEVCLAGGLILMDMSTDWDISPQVGGVAATLGRVVRSGDHNEAELELQGASERMLRFFDLGLACRRRYEALQVESSQAVGSHRL